MDSKDGNIAWQRSKVTRRDRQLKHGHASCVLWFTGLPGSGKSTLSSALEQALFARNISTYVLDGDNIRHGLGRDLGFTAEDRSENVRRVGEVAKLFVDAGIVVLAALISPGIADRRMVRALFDEGDYIEVYVKCSLEECEKRDPKGMYKKARSGQIANFTGVSAGYDIPEAPELTIDTEQLTVEQSVAAIVNCLERRNCLTSR